MSNTPIDLDRLREEDGVRIEEFVPSGLALHYMKTHAIENQTIIRFFPFEKGWWGGDPYIATAAVLTLSNGRVVVDIAYADGVVGAGFEQEDVDLFWPVLVEKFPELLSDIKELYGNFTPASESMPEHAQWTYQIPSN